MPSLAINTSNLTRACLLTFVCVGVLLGASSARGEGEITVGGENLTVGPDTAFTFTVSGHSEEPFGAFGITIFFDSGMIAPTSCQSTIALCNKGVSDGELRLNSVNLAGFGGDITFATIVFEAAHAPGSTIVDIDVTVVSDLDANDITDHAIVTDGSVTIEAGAPGTPTGDANCDSVVNAADGLAVLSQLAGAGDSGCFSLADVNCDDKVNAADALAILRAIGGLDVALPAGCSLIN